MKIIPIPGQLFTGLAIGAGAILFGPVLFPIAAGVLKTVTKAGIKGGILLYERGKVAIAEAQETVEDLTAEAQAELVEEKEAAVAPRRRRSAASTRRRTERKAQDVAA